MYLRRPRLLSVLPCPCLNLSLTWQFLLCVGIFDYGSYGLVLWCCPFHDLQPRASKELLDLIGLSHFYLAIKSKKIPRLVICISPLCNVTYGLMSVKFMMYTMAICVSGSWWLLCASGLWCFRGFCYWYPAIDLSVTGNGRRYDDHYLFMRLALHLRFVPA